MILTPAEIDNYRRGNFVAEFPHAILTQRSDLDHRDVISGPSALRQGIGGQLEVTIYVTSADLKQRPRSFGSFQRLGTYVDESEYFDFTGVDAGGRNWTAERLHVRSEGRAGMIYMRTQGALAEGVWICRADVSDARCSRTYSRDMGNAVWAWLPGEVTIPADEYTIHQRTVGDRTYEGSELNVWRWVVGEARVVMTRHEHGLEADISSPDPLPAAFHVRFEEALWLPLASRVQISLLVRFSGTEVSARLTPPRRPLGRPRLQAPLNLRDPLYAEATARMVASFLAVTSDYADEESYYHPLAVAVGKVLRGSEVDIETEALLLTTALEGLAEEYFGVLSKPEAPLVETVDDAVATLKTNLPATRYRERVISAVNALRRRNGRSALRRLADLGVLTEAQLRAWNRVRHPIVHGARRRDPPQEFGNLCNAVYSAFCRLMFQIVGYRGPHRAFETVGWPEVEFEPAEIVDENERTTA